MAGASFAWCNDSLVVNIVQYIGTLDRDVSIHFNSEWAQLRLNFNIEASQYGGTISSSHLRSHTLFHSLHACNASKLIQFIHHTNPVHTHTNKILQAIHVNVVQPSNLIIRPCKRLQESQTYKVSKGVVSSHRVRGQIQSSNAIV